LKTLLNALRVTLILLLLCGLVYPLAMTAICQAFFPKQAGGSLVEINGKKAGSELLGQAFSDPRYFHGRVSAVNYNTYTQADTKPGPDGKPAYQGVGSGSANLAPSNPALAERVKQDVTEFIRTHPGVKPEEIPADLVTSSGSGLDPHLSPAAARIQIPMIAKTTGISRADLEKLVAGNTEGRQWGIFGEPRVNILKVNLGIRDRLK
jgi:potassium-transporting ATPase KdpC subunit